jgi:hypothetical protein
MRPNLHVITKPRCGTLPHFSPLIVSGDQLVGILHSTGPSLGIVIGPVPSGTSKKVARKTAVIRPELRIICTWPCPLDKGGLRRVDPVDTVVGRYIGQLTLPDGDEYRSMVGVLFRFKLSGRPVVRA